MNQAVLFRSDRFSLEPTEHNGQVADLPLGNDLAALLRQELVGLEPTLWIDEPILEDWGTVLWVKRGDRAFYINIHWTPGPGGVENRWGIQFSEPRGCLTVLRRRQAREEMSPLQPLVARVLASTSDTFQEVEWLSQSEYEARL